MVSFAALEPYGWGDRWAALLADVPGDAATTVPGRVVRHEGTAVAVALPTGIEPRPLRRGLDPAPVVGDWVAERDGTLVAVLPRSSLLERRAARRDEPQALAANVDAILITCGVDRPVKAGRIRRTATLAWEAGAVPTVVLTKVDMLGDDGEGGDAGGGGEGGHRGSDGRGDPVAALVDQVVADNPGLDAVATSAATGRGMDDLRALVAGRTVVLLGESGAGKSSLVNALLGDEVAAVGAVRRGDAKGRHTTTTRQLHLVPGGGAVIDTPGIRAVGLWADGDAVAATFDDIEGLAADCRFNDCGHAGEPDCAVAAAVAAGELAAERLESWRALEREAAAAERRSDPQAQRRWGRNVSRVAKDAQRRKGRA